MIDPELWPRFSNRQMLRFVSIFRLSTLLICFILTDPKVHKSPGGYKAAIDKTAKSPDTKGIDMNGEGSTKIKDTAMNVPGMPDKSEQLTAVKRLDHQDSEQTFLDNKTSTVLTDAAPGSVQPAQEQEQAIETMTPSIVDGTDDASFNISSLDPGLSEPSAHVVGFIEQCKQIWDAMHQDRIWRPMIFICIYALVPGNGGAFNSFTQGCARNCTDPDTGEQFPPYLSCERDANGDIIDPTCREQPNPDWPGRGQYDGQGGTRGIEPMGFSSSLMAYVGVHSCFHRLRKLGLTACMLWWHHPLCE